MNEAHMKHKRLPPLPKFPKNVKHLNGVMHTSQSSNVYLQHRIFPSISEEEAQYIQAHDEYNQSVFEIWRKQKDSLNKAQCRQEKRYIRPC